MNLDSPLAQMALKLLLAMLCGGAIGLERELSRKPAGLRTNMLICLAATLFMITSRQISGGAAFTDPARLVAQVVAGIGFIGAGVILQSRGSVSGLTTAATIFMVTAVGIAIGDGLFALALLTTVLAIVVLVLLRRVEAFVMRYRRLYHYTFKTREPATSHARLLELLKQERLRLEDFRVRDLGAGEHEVALSLVASPDGNRRLMEILPQLGTGVSATTHEETD